MPHKESQYPDDWIRIAEKDWRRVESLLNAHDQEAAGFFLQQATEKFLKAFLLSKDWKLKRIHDLELLLNEALLHNNSFEKYRSVVQKISGFYFVERYPFILEIGLTEEDIKKSVFEVKGLIETIKSHLRK